MVRSVAILLATTGILNLALLSQAVPATALQSPAATPSIGFGFPAGIDGTMLGAVRLDELPRTPAMLRLEQFSLEPEMGVALHETIGAELLIALSGETVIADGYGLEASLSAEEPTSLRPNTRYLLRNDGSAPATLFRVALFSEAARQVTSDLSATPHPSTPTPCTVCVDVAIQDLPDAPATLYLARLTWDPGADSGLTVFTGLAALVVESGSLAVLSPSGIEGQLGTGKNIAIPAGVPTRERNIESTAATALLAGIAPTGQPIVAPYQPDPTATATVVQQASSPPSPTAASNITPPGSVLGNHDTWRTETALLTLDGGTSRSVMNGETILELELTYTNIGDAQVDFVVRPVFIRVYDDEGDEWGNMGTGTLFNRQAPTDQRVILAPEESEVIEMEFLGPVLDGDRKVTIAIEEFGDVRNAKWEGVVEG